MKNHASNPRAVREIRNGTAKLDRAERKAHRLSDQERADRGLTEIDFQRQLVGPNGLATMLGWLHVHFRPAKTERGWRTPGSGELLEGWPDLVLVRVRDRRLIFAELKRELADVSASQRFVLDTLAALMTTFPEIPEDYPDVQHGSYLGGVLDGLDKAFREAARVEVHVWRPSDLTSGRIQKVLS